MKGWICLFWSVGPFDPSTDRRIPLKEIPFMRSSQLGTLAILSLRLAFAALGPTACTPVAHSAQARRPTSPSSPMGNRGHRVLKPSSTPLGRVKSHVPLEAVGSYLQKYAFCNRRSRSLCSSAIRARTYSLVYTNSCFVFICTHVFLCVFDLFVERESKPCYDVAI